LFLSTSFGRILFFVCPDRLGTTPALFCLSCHRTVVHWSGIHENCVNDKSVRTNLSETCLY
jgi:hypothetical protein